ncbi:MAG: 16S rRNA (cytosine(1402)-N(4))-methyltransferase RsmH [Nevskia sp.]|nr:16S rRNA (cytosine(1402)-N(4))-methyltransferase RsmH [Nevskia sp.]
MDSHRPVMLEEALAGLAVHPGGTYVDGTFGRGGHARAILQALRGSGELHALDRDPQAGAAAQREFGDTPGFHFHRRNFAELGAFAAAAGIAGKVDGVLLDLGVSSPQFDDAARGFSFSQDGALDMRMDPQSGRSAAQWLAQAGEAEIADVLWRYGEERNSRRIARRIVDARAQAPIATTAQLAALIAAVPGPRSRGIHPATRSFQAIRIFINDELGALAAALTAVPDVLAPGGRLAVISFHSLEDRMVKRFIREGRVERGEGRGERRNGKTRGADAFAPLPSPLSPLKRILRAFPTEAELAANPRARSAVLRVAERVQ